MRQIIIGVMGGREVSAEVRGMAYELGKLIAEAGYVTLTGGYGGVMAAAMQGAAENGGLTVGILSGETTDNMSAYVQIPVVTGMGQARNAVNALSSDVMVACPGKLGTLTEIAYALNYGKPVILLCGEMNAAFDDYRESGQLHQVETPAEAMTLIAEIVAGLPGRGMS